MPAGVAGVDGGAGVELEVEGAAAALDVLDAELLGAGLDL